MASLLPVAPEGRAKGRSGLCSLVTHGRMRGREAQAGHQGRFFHSEGVQTLEQAPWRGGWCPMPVSVEKAF